MCHHNNCASSRCRMMVVRISFIIGMILLVTGACVVLAWAFASEMTDRFPNGSKIGGVLCAIGAVAVAITVLVLLRMVFVWKENPAKITAAADRPDSFHDQYSTAKTDYGTNPKILRRSFSSAYMPVTASVTGDGGPVQLFGLLSTRGSTLSAMELNASYSGKTENSDNGEVKSTAFPVGVGGQSKVHSEAIVPVLFAPSAFPPKKTSVRRSLSKVAHYQRNSNRIVINTLGNSKDEDAFATIGFLSKTFSEGVLASCSKATTKSMGVDGPRAQHLVNVADLPPILTNESISLASRDRLEQTGQRQPAVAQFRDRTTPPYLVSMAKQPDGDNQVISSTTLFDETVSEGEEDVISPACRLQQVSTFPCTDVFPIRFGDQRSEDEATVRLLGDADESSNSERPVGQASLVSRLKVFTRRLLRINGKTELEGGEKPPCITPTLAVTAETHRSTSRRKPTIVSNASVFSLPALPSALWTADQPVWIIGGLPENMLLVLGSRGGETAAALSATGSSSSVFAFHVRPPPRLRRATGQDSRPPPHAGASRRTRSLGRMLFSGDPGPPKEAASRLPE